MLKQTTQKTSNGSSPSRRQIIPDGNMTVQKGVKGEFGEK